MGGGAPLRNSPQESIFGSIYYVRFRKIGAQPDALRAIMDAKRARISMTSCLDAENCTFEACATGPTNGRPSIRLMAR